MAKKKPVPKIPHPDEMAFLRLELTRMIAGMMLYRQVSHHSLAERMNKPVKYVVGLLGGVGDIPIRELSDICTHLGFEYHTAVKR